MARPRHDLMGNLAGSLALLAVVAAFGFGLPALDRAVPAARPVPVDRPYPVGAGVTVVPPAGAELDVTRTRPAADRGTVLFLLGAVRYAITVLPFTGGLAGAVADLQRQITAVGGYQVYGPVVPVRTAAGVPGLRGGYTSPGRAGRYEVFLAGGTAAQVTIAGADPDLSAQLDALQASVASLVFPGSP
jgi:hypothetical protein